MIPRTHLSLLALAACLLAARLPALAAAQNSTHHASTSGITASREPVTSSAYVAFSASVQVGSSGDAQLPITSQSAALSGNQKPVLSAEQRADIHLARKEYVEAIEGYRRALVDRGSADAYLWNKLGIAYQMDQQYEAARKAYKKATRAKPDFSEPWNNLGTTYYLQNKFGKSARYYKRAIKLRPDIASFHMNLGASYSRMKKAREAIRECQEALRLDPNILSKHSRSATTVQARGTDAEFYYFLAKAFASMSRPNEATRYLRRALEDGFRDMKRLDHDPDFQKIAHFPAFFELRKNPPFPIQD
jgi:tetratricopeptide (TPR) repeat protein